jgi:hypothetical protein
VALHPEIVVIARETPAFLRRSFPTWRARSASGSSSTHEVAQRIAPESKIVYDSQALTEAQEDYADTGAVPYWNRTQEEIKSFFDGLELVEPGFVPVPRWRPEGIRVAGEEPRSWTTSAAWPASHDIGRLTQRPSADRSAPSG